MHAAAVAVELVVEDPADAFALRLREWVELRKIRQGLTREQAELLDDLFNDLGAD